MTTLTILNPSFESWSGSPLTPDNWTLLSGGVTNIALRSTDAQEGTYALSIAGDPGTATVYKQDIDVSLYQGWGISFSGYGHKTPGTFDKIRILTNGTGALNLSGSIPDTTYGVVTLTGTIPINATSLRIITEATDDGVYGYFDNYSATLTPPPPDTPTNTTPTEGDVNVNTLPTLTGSVYSGGGTHTYSQWQVATDVGFSSIDYDSGAITDLESHTLPIGSELNHNILYYWRVRYKDSFSQWSSYSTPTSFTTYHVSIITIKNPGFEDWIIDPDLPDYWTVIDGTCFQTADVHSGSWALALSGESNTLGASYQRIVLDATPFRNTVATLRIWGHRSSALVGAFRVMVLVDPLHEIPYVDIPAGVSYGEVVLTVNIYSDANTIDVFCLAECGPAPVEYGYFDDVSMTYAHPVPTVTTQAVTNISPPSAIGNGTITNTGGENCTKWGICWSISANPTVTDPHYETTGSTGPASFTGTITGLTSELVYHVRAYAMNSSGYGYGNDVEFTATTKPALEVVSTDVFSTIATINCYLNQTGGTDCTERGICWATHTYPTINDSHTVDTGAPFSAGAYTDTMTGLEFGAVYYVRAYAKNAVGYGYGGTGGMGVGCIVSPMPCKIEIAFNQSTYTTSPTWTDVSADVMELNTRRGRQHELDRVQAGIATITFKNISGKYWRYNTASSLYTTYATEVVKPLTMVRIRKEYGGVTYPIFLGLIEAWTPGWVSDKGGKSAIMTASCVDWFKSLNRSVMTIEQVAELSSARIEHVLDDISFPVVSEGLTGVYRNIDAGNCIVSATPSPFPDGGINAMEHLYNVADAENGLIFVSSDGKITFQSRDTRWTTTEYNTSQATFQSGADSLYVYPELSDDDTYIYNEARIKGAGDEQIFWDTTSISSYGERAIVKTDSLVYANADAIDQCYTLVKRYRESKMRCKSLYIMPNISPADLYPKVLGYDISTRITLNLDNTDNPEALGAYGIEYHIEGIEHNYKAVDNNWETKWQLWDTNEYQIFRADHNEGTGHAAFVRNEQIDTYTNVQKAVNGTNAYNDIADNAGGGASGVVVGQQITAGWLIDRGYLEFDTTALTRTIISAAILIKDNVTDTELDSLTIQLVATYNLTVDSPLVVADYGSLHPCTSDLGHIVSADWVLGGWNIIDLNAAGIAHINSGGITRFALRTSTDMSETQPTAFVGEVFNICGSIGVGGVAQAPRLIVRVL